jgi:SAM-dependent methyltransferase
MLADAYSGIDNLEVLEEAVRYNRFLLGLILDSRADAPRALDFGAGTGTLCSAVRERGLEVECVEPDPRLQERLRGEGFRVHGDLTGLEEGSREFIYSFNVLEHIADDEGTMAELFLKLRPGGRLLLYVPAFACLYSSMDRKVGHHRRYRMGPLASLARRIGFEVERREYADCLGFFVTLLYKAVGSREGEISSGSVRIYDRVVFPLSRTLDRMGMSRVLGKNLVLLLRRPGP